MDPEGGGKKRRAPTNSNPSRAFVFTLNNPEEALLTREGLDRAFEDRDSHVRYAIWQVERGAEGTTHLQGYLEFSKPVRLSHCKILIPRAHFEPRRGTRDQAIAYCEKEESRLSGPYEFGQRDRGGQGKRNDLSEVKARLDSGASEKEIANDYFGTWCRNYRAFERYRRIAGQQRDWKTVVEVFYGSPGTGKSRAAMDENPGAYWKPRGQWWDGYEGHEVVVLDEFYGWLTWDALLKICDRYPLHVESKGGHLNFLARKLVITTNRDPSRWYSPEFPFDAFGRRVDKWSWFARNGDESERHDYSDWRDLKGVIDALDDNFRYPDARFD